MAVAKNNGGPPKAAKSSGKSSMTRQVVNAVNPRLALYKRAGLLAMIILAINYAVVGALAIVLMQLCTTTTTTSVSEPESSGPPEIHESWINATLAREGVETSGPQTITTAIDGCHRKSMTGVTAPLYQRYVKKVYESAGYISTPGISDEGSEFIYEGTNQVLSIPCWNQYVPCSAGKTSRGNFPFDGDFFTKTEGGWGGSIVTVPRNEMFPCGFFDGTEVSGRDAGEYLGRYANFAAEGNAMGANAQKFKWCSADDEQEVGDQLIAMGKHTSSYGPNVTMAILCGDARAVPLGIRAELYPGSTTKARAIGELPYPTQASYTSHWRVTETKTVETCPTFSGAFADAFAFAAQIEIVITMVLLFLFRKARMLDLADDMVDLGSEVGVVSSSTLKQAMGAGALNA